jgi:hypothetical protein
MPFFSTNETKPRPKDPKVVRVVKTTNDIKAKQYAFDMNPGRFANVAKRAPARSAGMPLQTTDLRAIAERKKAAAAREQKQAARAAIAISAPVAQAAPQAKRPGRPRKSAR